MKYIQHKTKSTTSDAVLSYQHIDLSRLKLKKVWLPNLTSVEFPFFLLSLFFSRCCRRSFSQAPCYT